MFFLESDWGRSFCMDICEAIYKSIPKIYSIFYNIASARFFSEDDSIIEELSSNMYVLVSVIMLFIFSATFLSAIINPDIINDKKKGIGALIKRSFIGIILIILIPFGFDELYEIQTHVLSNNLVEKVIVGIDYGDEETAKNGGNGGQVIAGTLIGSFIYPKKDGIEVAEQISDVYAEMITTDINKIEEFGPYINIAPVNGEYEYALEFDKLLAIVAGIGAFYILLLFAMDMAIRLFTLAFYELTAPISVVAYMAIGDDQLKRWLKAVGTSLVDVYIRIAAMAFYVFLLSHLNTFLAQDQFKDQTWSYLLRALLVIGMLIFVKKVPDLINSAFGFKIESKGGIGGRLGSMAVAGGIAKKAWDKTKGALGTGVKRVAGLPIAAAGAGIGWGANKLWNGGKNFQGLKNTKAGRVMSNIGNAAGHAGAYMKGGVKGVKDYHKNSELSQEHAKQRALEREKAQQNRKSENFRRKVQAAGGGNDVLLDEEGSVMNKQGIKTQKALRNSLSNERSLNSDQRDATANLMDANSQKASIDKFMKARDDVAKAFESAQTKTGLTTEQINELENLKKQFKSGSISNGDLMSKLEGMVANGTMTHETAKGIAGGIDKMTNTMNNTKVKVVNSEGQVVGEKLMAEVVTSDAGGFNRQAITELKSKSEKRAEKAKAAYDKELEVASASQKEVMESYKSTSEDADNRATWERETYADAKDENAKYTEENKKNGSKNKDRAAQFIVHSTTSGGSSGSPSSGDSSGGSSGSSSADATPEEIIQENQEWQEINNMLDEAVDRESNVQYEKIQMPGQNKPSEEEIEMFEDAKAADDARIEAQNAASETKIKMKSSNNTTTSESQNSSAGSSTESSSSSSEETIVDLGGGQQIITRDGKVVGKIGPDGQRTYFDDKK